VLVAKLFDGFDIKGISECVSQHHGPCFIRQGGLELGYIDISSSNIHINKDGNGPYCTIGVTVVGNPQATAITSSLF